MATASNMSTQVSNIPLLNGTNFKVWKDTVEIVLGCMDLDLALLEERPVSTPDNLNEVKIEKWDRSNRMSIMIMKRSIPEAFQGFIVENENANGLLEKVEQYFAKHEKSEASNLLAKLVSMKYKGKENIREYIMEMSNLASKLKSLQLELSENLLVHLVLISLPARFGQFKVSYNTQKDKWSLSELISHCVQEEERLERDRTESAHLTLISQSKYKKRARNVVQKSSEHKKPNTQSKGFPGSSAK
ncbi:hypothetical protein LINGRAHAP2_LOCUS20309 [Linum grandiflorum]